MGEWYNIIFQKNYRGKNTVFSWKKKNTQNPVKIRQIRQSIWLIHIIKY